MRKFLTGLVAGIFIGTSVAVAGAGTSIFTPDTSKPMEARIIALEKSLRQITLDTNHHLVMVPHHSHAVQTQQPNTDGQTPQQRNSSRPTGNIVGPTVSPNTNQPVVNAGNPAPEPTKEAKDSCGSHEHGETWTEMENIGGRQWEHTIKCHDGREIPHGSRDVGPAV